jgi:HSP20 family molecular chaperone IbpA
MLFGGNFMADTLKVSPSICAYPDDKYENLEIEVVLPGVEKKDISFKITEDGFYVRATKEGVEYADSYAICCPVSPEKAVARYSNGVLKVTVPYQQPFEKVVDVKIE